MSGWTSHGSMRKQSRTMNVNLNSQATFTLTEAGARIHEEHMSQYPVRWREAAKPGDVMKMTLWGTMQIFGSSIYMGMPEVPFVGNELTLTPL